MSTDFTTPQNKLFLAALNGKTEKEAERLCRKEAKGRIKAIKATGKKVSRQDAERTIKEFTQLYMAEAKAKNLVRDKADYDKEFQKQMAKEKGLKLRDRIAELFIKPISLALDICSFRLAENNTLYLSILGLTPWKPGQPINSLLFFGTRLKHRSIDENNNGHKLIVHSGSFKDYSFFRWELAICIGWLLWIELPITKWTHRSKEVGTIYHNTIVKGMGKQGILIDIGPWTILSL